MRNIELKARLANFTAAVKVCEDLHADYRGDIQQVDTYFRVAEGRFKMRASDPGEDYLVYYRRPDVSGPKGCDYEIAVVDRAILPVLSSALGVLTVVDKTRTLYLWENVRIHLDNVVGLGHFIEFEAVLSDPYDDNDGQRKLAFLQESFSIPSSSLIEHSYLDMMLKTGFSAP